MVGTTSDLNGQFNIVNIKPGTYSIRISAIGYKTIKREITLDGNSLITLDIIFDEDEVIFPEVLITGKNDRIFSKIPGSVSFINTKEIKNINPISGNEVFRRTPGVHVVDEEGAGMRANIGIRGLDPDRSRSVLVLEDGIPVALAPYGEPEMYYTPPIDRMSGIEILKVPVRFFMDHRR
ncbi:MAG: TonB-dependent receptor plug domain-containing protein [Saprospiraceae bacterium]|nr:TonB-dependent receptor plug domain-containing protein [Saprospiraceae bacterium]